MKKIIPLMLLHFSFTIAFSQNIVFEENFERGILNEAWKINSGKWYVANLEEKGIKSLARDNQFALASAGDGEITIDIPVDNMDSDILLELSFTYWVYSKGASGLAGIVFLNGRLDSLASVNFEALPEKGKWDFFNQQFKTPKGTSVIRLRLGEREGWTKNTVYFKSIRITRPR